MRLTNFGIFFVIFSYVKCQESSLAGYDYILRSCISTAELIRTHRKTWMAEKMILTNRVAEPSDLSPTFVPGKPVALEKSERRNSETPLRTLSIRRSSKSQPPLAFLRKENYPEASSPRNRQQKRQRQSEVIFIKQKD